jgi:hypothetical protein
LPGKQAIIKKRGNGKAVYGNLMACASVWVCPICSNRIAQKRTDEILYAYKQWQADGGQIAMITYTFAHYRHQSLGENLGKLKTAYAKMQSQSGYRTLRVWHHQINAVEVLYGANGWHVHMHVLIFFKGALPDDLENKLFDIWSKHLPAKRGIGVNIKTGHERTLARYVSKANQWHLAAEIALGSKKTTKGLTYLQLLIMGDYKHALEYALATSGLNVLTWSRDSKKAFGIAEMDAQAIADTEIEPSELFATIPADLWLKIINRNNDLREIALELAEMADSEEEFIMMIESEVDNGS